MWIFLAQKALTRIGARWIGAAGRTRNGEYRTKPYYVNYNIRPIQIRRRYTRAYRPNLKAYSLPFYYSREGPAYKHNRRTRNFWYWRR